MAEQIGSGEKEITRDLKTHEKNRTVDGFSVRADAR